ncbi:MAG: class I SAM-dependent methyltransferase [Nitrospinota bacterium]
MTNKNLSSLSLKKSYKKQNLYYKQAYKKKDAQWSGDGSPNPMFVREIGRLKKQLEDKTALDLGSGEGRHSIYLNRQRFKVIGIEYQEQALKNAAGKGNKGLLYVRGDIYRIPLKPASFGLVIDSGVFHHIRRGDTEPYLKLLESLLVPGGCLLLSCFSTDFRHGDGKVYKRGFVVHKNHYDRFSTIPEMRRLFGGRFDVVTIKKAKGGFINACFRLKERSLKSR